jgi:hypothetical protein
MKSDNIRFNPLKHHLDYIRQFVKSPPIDWQDNLLLLGHLSFDIYINHLTIGEITEEVLRFLENHNINDQTSYLQFLGDSNNYELISLTDGSNWVLRWGADPLQFIHLHPARIGKYTIRVRSSALKTVITIRIVMQNNFPPDLTSVNQIRKSLQLQAINIKGMDKIISLFQMI